MKEQNLEVTHSPFKKIATLESIFILKSWEVWGQWHHLIRRQLRGSIRHNLRLGHARLMLEPVWMIIIVKNININ